MKIILPANTRYFERCGDGDELCVVDRVLGKDSEITINTKIVLLFLYQQSEETVAFQLGEKEYYFLVREIRIFGLPEKLRRLSKFEIVK